VPKELRGPKGKQPKELARLARIEPQVKKQKAARKRMLAHMKPETREKFLL